MLNSICADLDAARSADESGKYEMPESWRIGKPQSLGGAKAKGWVDTLGIAPKKFVIDQLASSLKMVMKHEMKSGE